MKPEHAQEIYKIISNLDDLANSHCIGDRDKIDEDVERARELLGLERPDVPEYGMVIEFIVNGDEYTTGWFNSIDSSKRFWADTRKCLANHRGNLKGSFEVKKWRYPGEKEWRE